MVVIESHTDEVWKLVDQEATLEKVATDCAFTEGPIWHPKQQCLLFSDIPNNARCKYTPDGQMVTTRQPSNKCNGMTYDTDLNLIVCEHLTSSLVMESPDGTRSVLASHYEGKQLNSPNDVCIRADGSIYFSDPSYGRMPVFGEEREQELDFQGVFRVSPHGGEIELVVERDAYEQPNGLCFSPDESLMYIADSPRALIDVYEVSSDGSLSNRQRFAQHIGNGQMEGGIPDGMKCDEFGNIWVSGPKGFWIFNKGGQHIGTLHIPEHATNLHWGGPDWHTLYIAANTSIYALRTLVGPHKEAFMGSSFYANH
ncbi:MAG: SMP-30/gluconolactonase/LRE family protein [Phycisphaerales bacterium]|nr:SMP-30/gluconolactonase/LRE family protein [Phycisphaerales bacterium]